VINIDDKSTNKVLKKPTKDNLFKRQNNMYWITEPSYKPPECACGHGAGWNKDSMLQVTDVLTGNVRTIAKKLGQVDGL